VVIQGKGRRLARALARVPVTVAGAVEVDVDGPAGELEARVEPDTRALEGDEIEASWAEADPAG
jgi:hypothetical protein